MPRNRKSPLTIQQRRDIARIRKIGSGKSATKLDDVTLGALIGFLEQDPGNPRVSQLPAPGAPPHQGVL